MDRAPGMGPRDCPATMQGVGQSVEPLVRGHDNLIACKSMSKAYALSGARVAHLAAGRHQLEDLRALTPPWVIGLPSPVAATHALECPDYYEARSRGLVPSRWPC